jgi:signal transduction histidine kinase
VERARGTGLEVELHLDVPDGELDGVVGAAASRIVQECLTNVIRHARAGRADVRVATTDTDLEVEVTDDGRGQDGGAGSGVGLLGMRERAQALGGTLTWGDAEPSGFRVTARLPRRGGG